MENLGAIAILMAFCLAIYAAVAALLAAVAFVAIWVPARRAARIDPLEALRAE